VHGDSLEVLVAGVDAVARRQRRRQDQARLEGRAPAYLSDDFQLPLLRGGDVEWKCRAGARFFHVCEDGLVHLCAPRTGDPGKPLAEYGLDDLRAAFHTRKPCATRCPVPYAHQASRMDGLRPQARLPRVRLPVLDDTQPAPRAADKSM